jgi:hypothetical protein
LGTPDVPRKHLHLVECRHIPNQTSRDEPKPAQTGEINAEFRGVSLTFTTLVPSVSCHQKLITGHIKDEGIPARARCGFGAYFNPPYFEDHWVCEYWNADEERWILVDPQFDEVWREKLSISTPLSPAVPMCRCR